MVNVASNLYLEREVVYFSQQSESKRMVRASIAVDMNVSHSRNENKQ